MMKKRAGPILGIQLVLLQLLEESGVIGTEVGTLKSRAFMEEVAKALNPDSDPNPTA